MMTKLGRSVSCPPNAGTTQPNGTLVLISRDSVVTRSLHCTVLSIVLSQRSSVGRDAWTHTRRR